MEINDRDSMQENNEKTMKMLSEGWKNVRSGKTVLNEAAKTAQQLGKDGFARAKALAAKKPLKEEFPPKPEEPAVDAGAVPAVDPAVPPVDAGAVPAVDPAAAPPVDAGAAPAVDPAAALAPVGLQPNPEKQLATQQFVQAALKGVQSGDADNKSLVTEYGFFKADINDPANGQFVVIAYPAGMKLKDIASIAEPVETPAAAGAEVAATEVPAVPGAEGGEAAPAPEGSAEDNKEDSAAGGEGAEKPEDEKEENAEALAESVRDPIVVGKKNWKSYLQGLLNESAIKVKAKLLKEAEEKKEEKKEEKCEEKCEKKEEKKEIKEEVVADPAKKVEELQETVDKKIEQIKEDIAEAKKAGDAEEVKKLEAQLERAHSEKNKGKTKEITSKETEKDIESLKKSVGKKEA